MGSVECVVLLLHPACQTEAGIFSSAKQSDILSVFLQFSSVMCYKLSLHVQRAI